MSKEKVFADGFRFERKEDAPEWVVGRLSIKIEDAAEFMAKHEKKGWLNLNVLKARSGNYYLELDTYEPKGKNDEPKQAEPVSNKPQGPTAKAPIEDELPF